MRKMKEWFVDKWHWLQTFNKMPTVTINCDKITAKEGDHHVIVMEGRVCVTLKGDIHYTSKEVTETKQVL